MQLPVSMFDTKLMVVRHIMSGISGDQCHKLTLSFNVLNFGFSEIYKKTILKSESGLRKFLGKGEIGDIGKGSKCWRSLAPSR